MGTTITLYLNEDSAEFCNEYRAREVIEKYCAFMPVPIFLDNEKAEPQYETIEKDELTGQGHHRGDRGGAGQDRGEGERGRNQGDRGGGACPEKYKILKRPVALNDTNPLWNKHPNECKGRGLQELLPQGVQGLPGAPVLDSPEYGLSFN